MAVAGHCNFWGDRRVIHQRVRKEVSKRDSTLHKTWRVSVNLTSPTKTPMIPHYLATSPDYFYCFDKETPSGRKCTMPLPAERLKTAAVSFPRPLKMREIKVEDVFAASDL